jgi:hypothetical protein
MMMMMMMIVKHRKLRIQTMTQGRGLNCVVVTWPSRGRVEEEEAEIAWCSHLQYIISISSSAVTIKANQLIPD